MSPYRRNVIVGLTVLIAMIILAWMILQFGGRILTPFTAKEIPIRIISDRADGLSTGSPVVYRGVAVGRVDKVTRAQDMITVYVDALVEASPPLPSNLAATIKTQGLIGTGAALALEVEGDAGPQGTLAPGAQIQAKFVGLSILPPEVTSLASEFTLTARQFRESNVIGNLNEQVKKVGKVLDSADSLLADPKLREDLQQSLANLRQVTDKANRAADNLEQLSTDAKDTIAQARGTIAKTEGHIDNLAKQLNDRAEQVATLLDRFNSIAAKIDQGQGTAGKLVNDPQLYSSLAATAQELSLTIKDFRRLVLQWEQEGMSLKLK